MEKSSSASGTSLSMVLFLIFLVLKLVGVIDWSWWWVTSPLCIGAALIILIFLIIGIVAFLFK